MLWVHLLVLFQEQSFILAPEWPAFDFRHLSFHHFFSFQIPKLANNPHSLPTYFPTYRSKKIPGFSRNFARNQTVYKESLIYVGKICIRNSVFSLEFAHNFSQDPREFEKLIFPLSQWKFNHPLGGPQWTGERQLGALKTLHSVKAKQKTKNKN